MQVGTLDSINSMVTTSSDQSKPTTGFAGILESLTLQKESQNESFGAEQKELVLSRTEIAELFEFFNIRESLNETDDLANLELSKFIEEFSEMEAGDALQSFIATLPFIEFEKVQLPTEKDPTRLLNTLKLVGMLSQDEGTNAKIQDFLQKASKQFESFINQNKLSSRMDILNKIVTPLAKELNGQQMVKWQKNDIISSEISFRKAQNDNDISSFNLKHRPEIMSGSSMLLQQVARPEQLTLMVNSTGKPVSAQELIQQFQSILVKSQLGSAGGAQKLFIKLNPENLGALRIEMILKDSTLIAKIQTTTSIAKDMLESRLHNLKNAFHSQNIVVDRVEISQQLSQQERFFNRDSQEQREQNQQGQQERNQENDQPQETSFQEALLNVEV